MIGLLNVTDATRLPPPVSGPTQSEFAMRASAGGSGSVNAVAFVPANAPEFPMEQSPVNEVVCSTAVIPVSKVRVRCAPTPVPVTADTPVTQA